MFYIAVKYYIKNYRKEKEFMAFAQNVQCFVIDRYYRHINEKFPSKCEDALLTAFHLYMFQSMGKVIKAVFWCRRRRNQQQSSAGLY